MKPTERITIAGFGGQGVMMIGQMIAYSGNKENKNSLWFPSYGPETRGGTANCAVIVSEGQINSPVFSKADTLIVLNEPSLDKFKEKIQKDGIILYNSSLIPSVSLAHPLVYPIPIQDIALSLGNPKVANMVMLGAYLGLKPLFREETISAVLDYYLGAGKHHFLEINLQAIAAGKAYVKEHFPC
ncbi:MAG: 2-oxoacid:acceptor oxidoreductase family protein [Bacilli bacterium]|jgi:2-oxoglutarate ferredoxin oxidoreductase subunit gamma|nr:2-oxoacid:acceptor oxidoreductase family protein [Bacilli bacterium]MDY0064125.1 2-oxoacid:acceptor oxidoreductase family protein [Bacilli bacterium]